MSSLSRTCLDGHRCENGSSCTQHPLQEGTYYCDCATSSGDVAGLFCEYQAETYCQLGQETSSNWFCVNKGTCVSGSAQCNCPPEYEGPHCQFIKGNVPRSWPGFDFDPASASSTTPRVQKNKLATGVTVAITFVVLIVVAMMAFLVILKRRRSAQLPEAQNAIRDHSEALKLDADGGVLQEIVSQSFSRTPNSTLPESANGHAYDFDPNIDEEASIEVERPLSPGPYSDNPKASRRNGSRKVNGYGGNIL
ncbi:EGF-like domain containing protein [Nitzschia inconspicua]|uniref:EGF-like domain containing protein n=1 Tax=Nitzschia inconspicua TaxID=303405 RepID=A0A9K3PRV7_9STRA|nr:EGF-like domain containing protein [Nitzschia inconspicua]